MVKALAACCFALMLAGGAWAQAPGAAAPPAGSPPAAAQPVPAPAPAPEQPAPAPTPAPAPAPEQPAPAPTPAPAPAPEQPTLAPAPAPAPAPEQPAPAPAPAPEQPAPAPAPAPEQPPAAATPEPGTPPQPAAAGPEQPTPEPPAPPIAVIEVRGNTTITTETIMAAIAPKVGEPYTAATGQAVEKAVRDLGWFYDVTVSTEPMEQGVRMVVNVIENPVVKGVVFEGNTVFSQQQLLALLETKPGQLSNNKTIIRDLRAIQDRYNAAGYIFARVADVATDTATGNLVVTLVEGKVEEIRVTGNRKTKTRVITREMRTRPGDILNSERLRRDLDRLNNLGIFQDVSAQPTVGSAPGLVVVTVNVSEKKTGLAAAGVGYSSVQKLVGFVDLAESNLRGTGRRVSLRTEFGGRESYELGYFDPWVASPATSLRVGLYKKLILRQAFTPSQSVLYDERRTGGNVSWSRPFGSSETTRIFATLRADSVLAKFPTGVQLDPALVDFIARQRETDVRSVALTLYNDTRNIIANPTRGALNSVSVEAAGLLGGASFNKLGFDVRRYLHAGGKRIFATRLLYGLTTGSPPFLEQYLVGGGETLRGYRLGRYPGTHMALLNTELRIPLQQSLAGVLFVDVGDAWGGVFARDLGDPTFKAHVGYGVGVRIITPIGPVRIDYGIGSEGQETHFSVGPTF